MDSTQRQKQIAQAEEVLGDRLERAEFAKGLFFGRYLTERSVPYPDLASDSQTGVVVDQLRDFCQREVDPVAIDRDARIPDAVVGGLGRLGILGACLPTQAGGRGMSQTQYCRLMEVLGGHCASTALFVNAHHSIGPRALVLFGTAAQQEQYLPKLATGENISAFALTEPEAGSDAANVQTKATPSEDGRGYVLNGEKRWITNGGIADVLTVMARTPVPGSKDTKITAFIVTPDMPGFEVVEERMSKCGVRGTATSRLAFRDMYVPKENILGKLGQGLRVALTVLDYGRVTFGASCTGAAKYCLEQAHRHCNQRVQFDQSLGSFELVKDKLAYMTAGAYAMEAMTYQTAALIDSGAEEYMLETAMLKVFATDVLWKIVNDTFQLFGGKAYFTDEPYERLLRDHRINTIGEGANDVLRAFVAAVGMRDVGLELKGILDALQSPLSNWSKLTDFTGRHVQSLFRAPEIPVHASDLEEDAAAWGKLIGAMGSQVERLLARYREDIVDRQYHLGRIGDCAMEIYAGCCVLNRLDFLLLHNHNGDAQRSRELAIGRYYLQTAGRRIRQRLAALKDNDDEATTQIADMMLREFG